MTTPTKQSGGSFGTNGVGTSSTPCPLGNIKYTVKVKGTPQTAPAVDIQVQIWGPKPMEDTLSAGATDGGFLHIPDGKYRVMLPVSDPVADRYVLPPEQTVDVPKSKTVTVDFVLDPIFDLEVIVERADGKALDGEFAFVLKKKDASIGSGQTQTRRAVVPKMRPGTYQLEVKIPAPLARRYAVPAVVNVDVPAGSAPPPARVKLELLPWIIVKVEPAPGQVVTAFTTAVKDHTGAVLTETSDDGKELRVEGLALGGATCSIDSLDVAGDLWEVTGVTSA